MSPPNQFLTYSQLILFFFIAAIKSTSNTPPIVLTMNKTPNQSPTPILHFLILDTSSPSAPLDTIGSPPSSEIESPDITSSIHNVFPTPKINSNPSNASNAPTSTLGSVNADSQTHSNTPHSRPDNSRVVIMSAILATSAVVMAGVGVGWFLVARRERRAQAQRNLRAREKERDEERLREFNGGGGLVRDGPPVLVLELEGMEYGAVQR